MRRVGGLQLGLPHPRHVQAEPPGVGSVGADLEGGWQLPRAPRVVVDHDYALCAIGLLAGPHPAAAYVLSQRLAGATPAEK